MPQNTPNLVLTCYDLTTDAGVYFSTFRNTLAGYTNSALTKIDTWAGTVNADLTALKQVPKIYKAEATKISDFEYETTISELTQYTTGMFINLSLDFSNVGTVTLQINNLGAKSVMKVNASGTLVNVSANDLRINKRNLFTYNGTAWVWVNAVSSDQLNVTGTTLNLTRISANNTLEDAGVSFAPTIVNNGVPQRTATGQLKGAVAVANDDVVNKLYADTIDSKIGVLSALETVDKTSVVGAVNENVAKTQKIIDDEYLFSVEPINVGDFSSVERYGVKIAKANSNPAGAMEYMYDAVGKQPAYMDFATGNFNYGDWANAFFIKQNRPVMLDTSWNVVEELDKTDQTKKTDGSPSSISSDASNLNAFAEFPQVWYKTYEDATHHYILISNVQYDDSYKCDVCKDATGKVADKWYFPMFDGSLVGTKMRSLADKPVLVSKTGQQEIDYCKANGANWYTLDKEQIHVFVMMAELIAKNRNSQQAFGDQVSLATNTAGINTGSLKSFGQFKGYNDGIHATKMFYCETGSLGYAIRYAGHITNANSEQLSKNYPPYDINGADYTNTGIIVATNGYIKDMLFNNDGIFGKTTGGSATTYWPDAHYFAPNCYARWRGTWNHAVVAGLRYALVNSAASGTASHIASALSGRKPV